MGGAVHAGFLRRKKDQGQQRGIGRFFAVAGQLTMQGLETALEIASQRRTQQLGGTRLQLRPVGHIVAAALAVRLHARLDLHPGNLPQGSVGQQHLLQLREIRTVVVARLVRVHAQRQAARHQHIQIGPVANDITFLRQQGTIGTAQRKRQRAAQLDGVNVQCNKVHGASYIILQ